MISLLSVLMIVLLTKLLTVLLDILLTILPTVLFTLSVFNGRSMGEKAVDELASAADGG